jgi:hypothetical protein
MLRLVPSRVASTVPLPTLHTAGSTVLLPNVLGELSSGTDNFALQGGSKRVVLHSETTGASFSFLAWQVCAGRQHIWFSGVFWHCEGRLAGIRAE